jgi:hypothetical protein
MDRFPEPFQRFPLVESEELLNPPKDVPSPLDTR